LLESAALQTNNKNQQLMLYGISAHELEFTVFQRRLAHQRHQNLFYRLRLRHSEPRADIFSDSGRLIEGVVIRAIQPFAALHSERAADSGRTVTPIPLAMAAVSVEIEFRR
jgi:hypothetical protein